MAHVPRKPAALQPGPSVMASNPSASRPDRDVARELRRAVALRRTVRSHHQRTRARLIETDQYCLNGTVSQRLRVILAGVGCTRPACTMCPLPDFGSGVPGDLCGQLERALISHPDCDMVSLYNDGSFFAPAEIPPRDRARLLALVAQSGASTLMVESLPEFITPDIIRDTVRRLGSVELVVGVGLQSISSQVRRFALNSPVRLSAADRALAAIAGSGALAKVYLLCKPPFLTEREARRDVLSSIGWLSSRPAVDITICPTRVVPGTLLSDLYDIGLYAPPALGTVGGALADAVSRGAKARVSLINVSGHDMAFRPPRTCPDCEARLVELLLRHNAAPGLADLTRARCLHCETAPDPVDAISHLRIRDRAEVALAALRQPDALSCDGPITGARGQAFDAVA